jgi:hypothetical protein
MHRRLNRLGLTLAVVGVVAALTFGIASGAPSTSHPRHATTVRVSPSVECPGTPGRAEVVTTPADPRLAASLAILRRPATPEDTPDAAARRRVPIGRGLHLADARLLRAEGDKRAWLVPVDDVRLQPLPERCVARAPAAMRTSLRRQRERFAAQPAQPGVAVLGDGAVEVGPSIAGLDSIVGGHAVQSSSCEGPSHDMLGVYALLPDGDTQPYLHYPDGHTVLGELRDNAVTFLVSKPDRRDQLPDGLAWTDAGGAQQSTPVPGGAFALQHCAAPPRFVVSRPVTGRGEIEAIAGGETPNATLDALAVKVRKGAHGSCPTIGIAGPGGLGRHVATYCVATPGRRGPRYVVNAQRPARLGHRALLAGWADPAVVRWIEIETTGTAFLVRPSRSGAFFVAYPDTQPDGRQWRMRAALRGRTPIPFTAYEKVTLGPTRAGVAPPGASPIINPKLVEHLAVFRRARTARDDVPRRPGQEGLHSGDVNPLLSRALGTAADGTRFFAVPGQHDLCIAEVGEHGGGFGCGIAARATDPARPMGGSTVVPGGIRAYALMPDGIDQVTVERNDGSRVGVAVRDNFFVVDSSRSLHRIWWVAPDGRHISLPGISHSGLGRARTAVAPRRPGQSAETQGRKIARQAVRDTARLSGCVAAHGSARPILQDAKPLSAITDLLPVLATPAPSADQRRALALLPPNATAGAVLRRTLRTVALPQGLALLVYVQVGGPGSVADPAGCGRARRRRAAQLDEGRPPEVQAWARRRLAQLRDTVPGLQTLWVLVGNADRPGATFGAGSPVIPGQTLRPGLRASGSAGGGRSTYIGIAGPRAARVVIRPRRPTKLHIAAGVDVVHGFYGVVLPKGTGPVELRELAADGTMLRSIRLRD